MLDLFTRYLDVQIASGQVRGSLRDSFQTADPFPWLVVDKFLQSSFLEELCHGFPSKGPNYDVYCRADDGTIGTDYANSNLGDFPPVFRELDRLLSSKDFLDLLSEITGIPGLIY